MSDPRAAFIEAAVWHGTLERADAILVAPIDAQDGRGRTALALAVKACVEVDELLRIHQNS